MDRSVTKHDGLSRRMTYSITVPSIATYVATRLSLSDEHIELIATECMSSKHGVKYLSSALGRYKKRM